MLRMLKFKMNALLGYLAASPCIKLDQLYKHYGMHREDGAVEMNSVKKS